MEKIADKERKYLKFSELTEGLVAERQAYLLRIKRRLDKNADPYLNFYLRTQDRVTLIGRKFKVEDKTDSGTNILSFNRMVVNVLFEVQIFNGTYSLLVKDLTMLPHESSNVFFSSYSGVEETFNRLNAEATRLGANILDHRMKTATLIGIQNGVTGAFIELVDMVKIIIGARKTEHTEKILKCLFAIANTYFQYLILTEKIEFLPKKEILNLLQSTYINGDEELTSVVTDTLSSLMNQGKPEHLYAHIITNAFNIAAAQIRNEELVMSSPKNLIINIEEGKLIYY